MKRIQILLLLVFVFTLLSSFKKRNNYGAGTGGDVTTVANPKHYVLPIYNQSTYFDTIYFKINTLDEPGTDTSNCDVYFTGHVGEDFVRCNGLKCGEYYLLATVFDTTINEKVFGDIPFTKTDKTGELNLNIPVVE